MLRPSEIGVLASLGYDSVSVFRRPIVAILATGNELLEPGDPYQPGMIYNSNTYSIAASVLRYGGVPKLIGIARDNLDSMNASLRDGLGSDMLVTSAGVSKGDYDMVKDVLSQHGEIDFWSVRMRPAKPLAFGILDAGEGRKVPLLGLPGNPVSALVAFEQFGRAAIRRMLGKPDAPKPTITAILDEPIYNTDSRRVFARAIIRRENGIYRASLTGSQSSNLLTSMARANGPRNLPRRPPRQASRRNRPGADARLDRGNLLTRRSHRASQSVHWNTQLRFLLRSAKSLPPRWTERGMQSLNKEGLLIPSFSTQKAYLSCHSERSFLSLSF